MALPSTIHKLTLHVSDLDRGYYAEHALTLARHPSETEERLMARVLAFAMHASARLEAGRGLSCIEDPDWLERELDGTLARWIDVGLPDLKRVKRALSQARQVAVLSYGGRATDVWWQKEGPALQRLERARFYRLGADDSQALTAWCARSMALQCTVQDGEYCLSGDAGLLQLRLDSLN